MKEKKKAHSETDDAAAVRPQDVHCYDVTFLQSGRGGELTGPHLTCLHTVRQQLTRAAAQVRLDQAYPGAVLLSIVRKR